MDFKLFGLKLGNKNQSLASVEGKKVKKSFVLPQDEDAIPVEAMGGAYGMYLDTDGTTRSDTELIYRYREMAAHPEVDSAVSDIVGEAVACADNLAPVKINLDLLKFKVPVKTRISEEFEEVLRLLKFQTKGYDLFRRWYVDSRIVFHKITDPADGEKGLVEVRWIDPVNIQKIKQFHKEMTPEGQQIITKIDEFYVYNKDGFKGASTAQQGLKISPDAITYVSSGLLDSRNKRTVGYLHKAIKPLNQLKMMEDSIVIYRITRSPERRVFYIDVGSLPKAKAEQYVRDLMNRFKNKLIYDAATGEIRDDKRTMSMIEDFWLPRREGGKGTEITTLPGGCLAMDTQVSLLDGRNLSIREIEQELKEGKELWTYSCHPTTGEVVPGLISWAGVTQESAEVIKLTLDNGQEIICTPDHEFPQYGTGFTRADQLTEGSSLIPLYKRMEKLGKLNYEQIYDNSTKTWNYTHRKIGNYLKHNFVFESTFNDYYINENKNVIHHKNFNRFDNSPSNLTFMNWFDHCELHQFYGFSPENQQKGTATALLKFNEMRQNNPEEYKKWCAQIQERMINFWKNLPENEYNELCQNMKDSAQEYWATITPEYKLHRAKISAQNCRKGTISRLNRLKTDSEYHANWRRSMREAWTPESRALASKRMVIRNNTNWNDPIKSVTLRKNHRNIQKIVIDNIILTKIIDLITNKTTHEYTIHDVVQYLNENAEYRNHFIELNKNKRTPNWKPEIGFTSTILQRTIKDHGYKSWVELRKKYSNHNHRVIKIEKLPNKIQVGTLTIDQYETVHDYHTFALTAGVFTKNSNLSQMDDVLYFQKKLYQSLNVPLSRLGASENKSFSIGKTTEIQRDEIKFSKFITRLRNKFSELFLDLLKTQLILKNIVTPEDWEQMIPYIYFIYDKDSYFAEMKDSELLRERLDALAIIEPYIGRFYSKEWVQKNVLKMTDTDIDEQIKKMESEAEEEAAKQFAEQQANAEMQQQMGGGGMDPNNPDQPFDPNQPPQQMAPQHRNPFPAKNDGNGQQQPQQFAPTNNKKTFMKFQKKKNFGSSGGPPEAGQEGNV